MHEEAHKISKSEILRNIFILILVIAAIYGFSIFLGIENIREKVEGAGVFGPLFLIVLKALTLIIAPLSGSPLYPISGALFGFTKGFIYMTIGDVLGTSISFYISRIFGRKVAEYFVTKYGMKAVDDVLKHLGTKRGMLRARLIFFGFQEAVAYAAGLTSISFWWFLLIHNSVNIVPHAILVALGDSLAYKLDGTVILLGGVVVFLLTLLGSWWFFKKSKEEQT
ncbi:MAG: VTT domain-containing protein [Patescibacteria group bacterium]